MTLSSVTRRKVRRISTGSNGSGGDVAGRSQFDGARPHLQPRLGFS
jgi:hypothetical protein